VALITLGQGFTVCVAKAQRPTLDEIARGGPSDDTEGVAGGNPRDYSSPFYKRQKAQVKRLCSRLSVDGRLDLFTKLMEPLAQSDVDCKACGPLGKIFVSACARAKSPKGIPASSMGKLQREPHILVTQAAGELFTSFANDAQSREESARFVARLLTAVQTGPGLSLGAKDYFATVAESIREPFSSLLGEEIAKGAGGRGYLAPLNPSDRKQVLDDLF